MKKLIMIIFTLSFSMFIISSCEKENENEEDTKMDIPQVDSDKNDINKSGNNNSSISEEESKSNSTEDSPNIEKKYIVNGWTTGVELSQYAGNKTVSLMSYNGPWRAVYSGRITGFGFSPSSGVGNVVINMSYDETKYESSKSEIAWNESGYITVYVREGTESNWTERPYSFLIRRYGRKMKL